MVHVNYSILDRNTLSAIKTELEERHRHVQWGVGNNWDFDSLVQNQSGIILVERMYIHEINISRNSNLYINYLVFMNKGPSTATGAVILAGALCGITGLPYAIAYLNRQQPQAVERVKWGGLCNTVGYLDGEGILLTDHLSDDNPIKSASEEVSKRNGKIKLVLAYSSSLDLEQRLREELAKKGTELKVLFNTRR